MFNEGDLVMLIDARGLDRSVRIKRGVPYQVRAAYQDFIDIGVISGPRPGLFAWRFRKVAGKLPVVQSESIVPCRQGGAIKERSYGEESSKEEVHAR